MAALVLICGVLSNVLDSAFVYSADLQPGDIFYSVNRENYTCAGGDREYSYECECRNLPWKRETQLEKIVNGKLFQEESKISAQEISSIVKRTRATQRVVIREKQADAAHKAIQLCSGMLDSKQKEVFYTELMYCRVSEKSVLKSNLGESKSAVDGAP